MNRSSALRRLAPRSPARESRDFRRLPFSPSLRLSFSPSLLLSLCLALGATLPAQEARTRPIGFLTQTIPSGQTRSFSIPFEPEVSGLAHPVGRLTAVGADYFENTAAAWTPGAYSASGSPYHVRLTSGAHAGRAFRIISPANTATRLYVADDGLDLPALGLAVGTAGDTFEIIPGDTLASFFGTQLPGDELVVHGAATPLEADVVQVWGGAAWLNFYYNTAWQRWARDSDKISDPSRNGFLLRADRGVMLTRRAATPLELTVAGRVLATPQRSAHSRSANTLTFLATMQAADTTLAALALQQGTRTAAWRGAADAADADLLLVWSGATWFSFYYNTANARWQRAGDPADRDAYVIRAGTPVFVQRRAAGTTTGDLTVAFPASGN
jgi:hypothetical protein